MDKVIINYAIMFCLRQLAKFGAQTDWKKVEADFDPRIRDVVPGTWLDDAAVGGANACIEAFGVMCQDTSDLAELTKEAMAGDFTTAFATVRKIVLRGFNPTTPAQVQLKAMLLAA